MKLKFLATGQSPKAYEIQGETIIADGESFDLSVIEHGGEFEAVEPDVLTLPGSQIIRDCYRDEHGELHVTLCQASPLNGHWRESEWIDAEDYRPNWIYIRQLKNGELIPAPVYMEDTDGEH